MPDWLAQTEHMALDDEGVVYLREGDPDEPDWRRLGGINEGRTYRKCPRELTEEWWAIEDAWWESCEGSVPFDEWIGEANAVYRKQQIGATW